jgi:hypothetical protein
VQERITLFTPQGRVARTLRISGAPAWPGARPTAPAALLADGTVVGDPTLLNLAVRPRHPLVILDPSGRPLATLAEVDGRGRSRRARVGRFLTTFRLPVQHHALWEPTADGDGVVVVERGVAGSTRSASFRVTGVGRAGTAFSREVAYTPRPLPANVRDSIAQRWAQGLARLNVPREAALRFARDSLGIPEFQPPVSALVAGRDGTIWLQREPFGRTGSEWLVLDRLGNPVATVTGRPGVRLLAARRDLAWGVVTDELDVPYVVRFRVQPAR